MVNLNQKILLEIPVGIPPLAEQSRIVAKVEELIALCDRLEAEQGHAARLQGHWVDAALDQFAESADADEFRRHWQHLAAHFDTLFTTPESIDRLDATLLQLAVRGKLVPQDPNDETASELLKQIRAEKDRLIKEGKIKRDTICVMEFTECYTKRYKNIVSLIMVAEMPCESIFMLKTRHG